MKWRFLSIWPSTPWLATRPLSNPVMDGSFDFPSVMIQAAFDEATRREEFYSPALSSATQRTCRWMNCFKNKSAGISDGSEFIPTPDRFIHSGRFRPTSSFNFNEAGGIKKSSFTLMRVEWIAQRIYAIKHFDLLFLRFRKRLIRQVASCVTIRATNDFVLIFLFQDN